MRYKLSTFMYHSLNLNYYSFIVKDKQKVLSAIYFNCCR